MAYTCSYCGQVFPTYREKSYHQVYCPQKPTTTPTPTPTPTVTIGEYVTHKSPVARSGDTILGKITGYLSELLFWADIEGKCRFIDAIIPEILIIGQIDNLFINMFQKHYNANYQKQYNRGADQGNKMNQQIMGWVDEAKEGLLATIDDTKRRIETELINPLRDKIRTLEPRINDAINRMQTVEGTVKDAENRINEALGDVRKLDAEVNNVVTKVNATITKMNTAISNFDSKLGVFEGRLAEANNLLNEHTNKLNELFNRVRELEEERRQILKIPSIREALGF